MNEAVSRRWLIVMALLLGLNLTVSVVTNFTPASAQKQREYKVVEVMATTAFVEEHADPPATTITQRIQQALNNQASAGWELVAVSMGELTPPMLIFTRE